MQALGPHLPTTKTTSTSPISTKGQASQFNSDTIKAVFDSVKVLGLENMQGLCEYTLNQSQTPKTPEEKLTGTSDLAQILNSKGFRAEQLLDKGDVHLNVWDKTNHQASMNWLFNLNQADLKKINALLITLDKSKQTILDAFKPGALRNEKIDVVGSWYDFLSPHIVAEEGCLYIKEGVFSDDTVLLTRNELFVLFKENLNERWKPTKATN